MAADTFSIRANGLFYDLVNDRTGAVEVELIDCIGEARNYREEYAAAAIEADTAEQAALAEQDADYRAESDMLDAIYVEVMRKLDASLPETDPRNRAVRLALEALDGISKPVVELAEAA
ncbi:hypothetical protein SR39_13600 [Methylobacterium radiotolerans]|nr:hypothetical protein SR39_13600 [Methylobacterium radiotolerans]